MDLLEALPIVISLATVSVVTPKLFRLQRRWMDACDAVDPRSQWEREADFYAARIPDPKVWARIHELRP